MSRKQKSLWVCKECGNESPKFNGVCFGCGEYNTMEESVYFTGKSNSGKSSHTVNQTPKKSRTLQEVEDGIVEKGFSSGVGEFDRICGGQVTEGSVILLGGDPGNGKSTLLSTISNNISEKDVVLYVSGEESEYQLKNRMVKRMNISPSENLFLLYTNNIQDIEDEAERLKPKFLVVDSINTIGSSEIKGDPGDRSQMRHCTARILTLAKEKHITVCCIAQITKDGNIAGPKSLEHMVDTVLHLEGDEHNELRSLSVKKNRFGSTEAIGLFRMIDSGLEEIPNPSEYLLKNRPKGESGTSVICISDTRPLMIEVQALTSNPGYEGAIPRRTSEGFSRNRLNLLIAVLEKKCNVKYLSAKDIFINVVGGLSVDEPGADLGVAMAIYSSVKNSTIPDGIAIIGEVGLAGEVRSVSRIEQLVKECERVGFETCIIPKGSYDLAKESVDTIKLVPVKTLRDCIRFLNF